MRRSFQKDEDTLDALQKQATDRWNQDHSQVLKDAKKDKKVRSQKSNKLTYIAGGIAVMLVLFMVMASFLFWPKSKLLPPTPAVGTNKFLDDVSLALPSYVYRSR